MPNQNGRPWTEQEDTVLRWMWDQTRTAIDIGVALNRSRKSVEARAVRIGLPGRHALFRPAPRPPAPRKRPPAVKLKDKTFGVTSQDTRHQSSQAQACRLHLVDLMREFGGKTVGEAKASYRERCELYVPPGAEKATIYSIALDRSFCGSPAAFCAG